MNTIKCSVNITTNRNRVKDYSGKVYLKDGQKFELEIYNPHNFKVLAKIKFNGQYISNTGIILRPGQRVYLERYIDTESTFIFSTYEVDGTVQSLKAIAENGNIEVEFYSEYVPSGTFLTTSADWTYRPDTIRYQPDYYFGSTNSVDCLYSTSLNEEVKGSLETGRIEKGEVSNQQFGTEHGQYNCWYFEKAEVKMLPVSAKPTEISEIRNYCTNCGTRVKKASWKYCPSCGDKI